VGEDDDQPRGPQPGVAQVADLVAGARDAGLDVRLTSTGEETSVAPGVGLAAYRIVQEALTNAAKHSSGPAIVVLGWEPHQLTVEVTSHGAPAGPAPGSGRGLVGMRERAQVVGGRLEAGPEPGGAFRVRAVLPNGMVTS
jgi:signal transduction histidine kinase